MPTQLSGERLLGMIEKSRGKIEDLSEDNRVDLDKTLNVSFDEHFSFQNLQARYHAIGLLTTDAAQIVYVALGEIGSEKNGGWAADTDLATKVIVTQLMGELLSMSIAEKRGHKLRVTS